MFNVLQDLRLVKIKPDSYFRDMSSPSSTCGSDVCWLDTEEREIRLERHQQLGFGFVAGAEKPVIVR